MQGQRRKTKENPVSSLIGTTPLLGQTESSIRLTWTPEEEMFVI